MKKVTTIIFLLITGLSIYWILSPNIYLFKIMGIKNQSEVITSNLMMLVRNYLPDILWAIAINLTAIEMAEKKFSVFYVYALIILPFLTEFLQSINIISGTFDWYDMLIYFLILLLCFNKKITLLCKKKLNTLLVP